MGLWYECILRRCKLNWKSRTAPWLVVGCLTSQQHASVSQGRICFDNFTCGLTEILVTSYRSNLLSCRHSIFTQGQPVLSLILQRQTYGGVATGVPVVKSSVRLDQEKSPTKKAGLDTGSATLEADTLPLSHRDSVLPGCCLFFSVLFSRLVFSCHSFSLSLFLRWLLLGLLWPLLLLLLLLLLLQLALSGGWEGVPVEEVIKVLLLLLLVGLVGPVLVYWD